ncbi:MAG: hypothetical protein AB8C13_00155 [Phycisphaerales bacterium]
MTDQPKTRLFIVLGAIAASFMLAGCTSSHPSTAWQGRSGHYAGSAGGSSALVFLPQEHRANTVVFASTPGPEFGRRDHTLSTRDLSRRDELFGVRAQTLSDLNSRRVFRSSRRADEYSYPSERSDRSYGYRRSYRSR